MRFPSNAITTGCDVAVSDVVKRLVLRLLNKSTRDESKSFLFLFKKRLFVYFHFVKRQPQAWSVELNATKSL